MKVYLVKTIDTAGYDKEPHYGITVKDKPIPVDLCNWKNIVLAEAEIELPKGYTYVYNSLLGWVIRNDATNKRVEPKTTPTADGFVTTLDSDVTLYIWSNIVTK